MPGNRLSWRTAIEVLAIAAAVIAVIGWGSLADWWHVFDNGEAKAGSTVTATLSPLSLSETAPVFSSTQTPIPSSSSTPTQTATSTPVPPPPLPTVPPTPAKPVLESGQVYEVSTREGFAGWLPTSGWKQVGDEFVNDGSNSSATSFAAAPVDIATDSYYVEAEIGLVRWDQCFNSFGLAIRSGAYSATLGRLGIGFPCPVGFALRYNGAEILSESEDVSGLVVYNIYRIEVNGNRLKFLVNGREVGKAVDNRSLGAGAVGVVSVGAQVNVRLFRVVGE